MPAPGSQKPASSFATVDFPEPEGPTSATMVWGAMSRLRSCRTSVSPYANPTWRSASAVPSNCARSFGRSSSGVCRNAVTRLTCSLIMTKLSDCFATRMSGAMKPSGRISPNTSTGRAIWPCIYRSRPTGSVPSSVQGMMACTAADQNQHCRYQAIVEVWKKSTARENAPYEEAERLKALITWMPFTYSTSAAFMAFPARV